MLEQETARLAVVDPVVVFASILPRLAPAGFAHGPEGRTNFEQLARSIAYQQLAGRAAETIWGRVRALVMGAFSAEAVLSLDAESLRGAVLCCAVR